MAPFEALATFPALAAARDRLLRAADGQPATGELIAAVESDVALAVATLRRANRGRRYAASAVEAVELLTADDLRAIATSVPTFDVLERAPVWDAAPERFRLHALATQRAAERIAAATGYPERDRLMITALLHDVGKLLLLRARPSDAGQVLGGARAAQERIDHERRTFGVDHAIAGGELARRWGLPDAVARAIEHHHGPDPDGDAAHIRLADLLVHHTHGGAAAPDELLACAQAVGLEGPQLRTILYELSCPSDGPPRASDPCPLSARELQILERLAEGKVYKQIALELDLAASTVRSHLHNIYGKLGAAAAPSGAMDRAQAVLLASERGWLSA